VLLLSVVIATAIGGFWFRYQESLLSFEATTFMGIPAAVWLWALIGTLTSMLLRAGAKPFADRVEAKRWLVYRPVVGVVMGVMIYLLLQAGLIVFTDQGQTQTEELVWVVAFFGGFSDSFSVNLLNRILGAGEEQAATRDRQPAGSARAA
jgi:hypothetical protein